MIKTVKREAVYQRTICPAFEIDKHGGCRRFHVIIQFSTDGILRMCGEWHGYGQNYDDLTNENLVPSDGYEYSDLLKIQSIWKRWHLNDLRAGTPRQEEFVRNWKLSNAYDYSAVCQALENAGLLIDNGYRYGSSWVKEDVPQNVIKYLFSLPAVSGDSWDDINPVQVNTDEFLSILMGR